MTTTRIYSDHELAAEEATGAATDAALALHWVGQAHMLGASIDACMAAVNAISANLWAGYSPA